MANQEERKSNGVDSIYMPIPGNTSPKKRNLPLMLALSVSLSEFRQVCHSLGNSGLKRPRQIRGKHGQTGRFCGTVHPFSKRFLRAAPDPTVVDCDHLCGTSHA